MGHTSTTVSWEKANSDASNYKEGDLYNLQIQF